MKHKFPKSKGPAKIQHSASSAKTTVQSAVRPEDNIYRGKFHYSKSQVAAKSNFSSQLDNNNQPATLGIIKHRRRRRQRQPSPPTLSYASTW